MRRASCPCASTRVDMSALNVGASGSGDVMARLGRGPEPRLRTPHHRRHRQHQRSHRHRQPDPGREQQPEGHARNALNRHDHAEGDGPERGEAAVEVGQRSRGW